MATRNIGMHIYKRRRMDFCSIPKKSATMRRAERKAVSPLVIGAAITPRMANQTLSVFTLWAITVYLVREKKGRYYYVTYFPALFMTAVCTTYICIAPEGFGLGPNYALGVALIAVVLAAIWFNIWYFKTTKKLW